MTTSTPHSDPVPHPVPTLSPDRAVHPNDDRVPGPPSSTKGTGSAGHGRPCPPTLSHTHGFNPGTTWLITPRTAPAWRAVYDLLADGDWHHIDKVYDAMRDAAGLRPRTIEHHLRSAVRRRWITRRDVQWFQLREPALIVQALADAAAHPMQESGDE